MLGDQKCIEASGWMFLCVFFVNGLAVVQRLDVLGLFPGTSVYLDLHLLKSSFNIIGVAHDRDGLVDGGAVVGGEQVHGGFIVNAVHQDIEGCGGLVVSVVHLQGDLCGTVIVLPLGVMLSILSLLIETPILDLLVLE